VEQDRAPALRLHHTELARQTAFRHQVIIQLIANTTTDTGLTVACRLDNNTYQKGIKVSDAEMATLTSTRTGTTLSHGRDQTDDAVIQAQAVTMASTPR
jgi:Rhodopirellula transposase DDE domain